MSIYWPITRYIVNNWNCWTNWLVNCRMVCLEARERMVEAVGGFAWVVRCVGASLVRCWRRGRGSRPARGVSAAAVSPPLLPSPPQVAAGCACGTLLSRAFPRCAHTCRPYKSTRAPPRPVIATQCVVLWTCVILTVNVQCLTLINILTVNLDTITMITSVDMHQLQPISRTYQYRKVNIRTFLSLRSISLSILFCHFLGKLNR